MRLTACVLTITALGVLGAVAFSQPAPPTCDSLLADQYRQLVTDQVLAANAAGLGTDVPQQLGAIIAQLRIVTTQYYQKLQQALAAEGQVASRDEHIRQLRQQVQTLTAEVEHLRGREVSARAGSASMASSYDRQECARLKAEVDGFLRTVALAFPAENADRHDAADAEALAALVRPRLTPDIVTGLLLAGLALARKIEETDAPELLDVLELLAWYLRLAQQEGLLPPLK